MFVKCSGPMQLFKLTFYVDQGRKTRVYHLTLIPMMCINT